MTNEEAVATVVILAGGRGLRLKGYAGETPKALVEVGGKPMIMRVAGMYSRQGFRNFIICLGPGGELIKKYFAGLCRASRNGRMDGSEKGTLRVSLGKLLFVLVDTGLDSSTGRRIRMVERLIEGDNFLVAYCDGLADINLRALLRHHILQKRVGTITVVRPLSRFGVVEVDMGRVVSFEEKPRLPFLVNGGFFVFRRDVFRYLKGDGALEAEPLRKLVALGQLSAYVHRGFWACMDTYKDVVALEALWRRGKLSF